MMKSKQVFKKNIDRINEELSDAKRISDGYKTMYEEKLTQARGRT